MEGSLIRVSTKVKVTPKVPRPGVEVQYPKAWFEANPDDKPVLSITLVTGSLENTRGAIRKAITDNTISLDLAKTYLYYYAETIKMTLSDNWMSYGRLIGHVDTEITPLDLLTVKRKIVSKEITGSSAATESDDPWMAGYLLCIYRLIRAGLNTYKSQIAKRVSTQLKAITPRAAEVTDTVDLYKGWAGDRGYNTLVAAYDMFFNKFPTHPYSNVRIGTTGSRFRDCAALMSYGYLMDLLGMGKATDVMDWVFLDHIGNDIDRMMTSEEELTDSYSYFPYHVDMGLVNKSAFSATANPHFFEWVHIIGALMRSPRSINAKHISDSRAFEILANAACVAYTFNFSKVCTSDGTALALAVDDEGDEEKDEMSVLRSRDPGQWCLLIKSKSGTLPKPVRDFVLEVVRNITETRDGTIDRHLTRIVQSLV